MSHQRYGIPATKLAELDEQHEKIFRSIKTLLDACRQGKNQNEVSKAAAVIENQAAAHFIIEEEYMIDCHYPGYEDHKAEHQKFIKGFADVRRQIEAAGWDKETVIEMNLLVANWLADHIGRMDVVLGAFLTSKLAGGKGCKAEGRKPGTMRHPPRRS